MVITKIKYLSSSQKDLNTNFQFRNGVHRETKRISRAHLLRTSAHSKRLRERANSNQQQYTVTPQLQWGWPVSDSCPSVTGGD